MARFWRISTVLEACHGIGIDVPHTIRVGHPVFVRTLPNGVEGHNCEARARIRHQELPPADIDAQVPPVTSRPLPMVEQTALMFTPDTARPEPRPVSTRSAMARFDAAHVAKKSRDAIKAHHRQVARHNAYDPKLRQLGGDR